MNRTFSSTLSLAWAIAAATVISATPPAAAAKKPDGVLVRAGAPVGVRALGAEWRKDGGALQCSGTGNVLMSVWGLDKGDFQITARLSITKLDSTAASFMMGASNFGFDGKGRTLFTEGPLFGKLQHRGKSAAHITEGKLFEFSVVRRSGKIAFRINDKVIAHLNHSGPINGFGFRPHRGRMGIIEFIARGNLVELRQSQLVIPVKSKRPARRAPGGKINPAGLRMAIEDLMRTFPNRYKGGAEFLARLDRIKAQSDDERTARFTALKREALLANPLLDFKRLVVVRRRIGRDATRFDGGMWGFNSRSLGIPDTGSGNTILPRKGFNNEIAILSPISHEGRFTTLYKPKTSVFVGDVDLHWDATKMLFSSIDLKGLWQIFEAGTDAKPPRQVTRGEYGDVDNYDACYLPDGGIIFGSTRSFQRVPCRSTLQTPITLLYRMDADGANIRQLTFDQDHNWCPTVLPDGRVLYLRWEYSGIPHGASRILFQMNPDGTGQTAYYGSNSHWPNCVFFARPVPDRPGVFTGVVSGNHDVPRMGELLLFDRNKSTFEADGVVQRIPGRGKKVVPIIADTIARNSWPKFLHPWPLSDKYFITACKPTARSLWGIYLVDTFDNLLLLREETGEALLEPIPLHKTKKPPVIPSRIDPSRKDATVFLADIYRGGGLAGVPRGAVKKLRLFTYHFQYFGMSPNVRNSVGGDGPWEPLRVLGTVPVADDGSASFRVPANTPISIQPLDESGAALQLMRSWFTAMPGENVSCLGCHESQKDASPVAVSATVGRKPSEITPWYGPPRGFSFRREVQPVLQKYCVGCHNGKPRKDGKKPPDLRRDKNSSATGAYSRSYRALYAYTRTPSLESDMHMLIPGDFHADNSELIRMLRKGHRGVKLSAEAWERLITWIDLCVPFYGTWHELAGWKTVKPASLRRRAMLKLYAGIDYDPESVDALAPDPDPIVPKARPAAAKPPAPEGWPFDAKEAKRRQSVVSESQREILLSGNVKLTLVYIPKGKFVMGDLSGADDERPLAPVSIDQPFWMGKFEVTNEQFAQFDSKHNSRWIKGPGQQYSSAERGWRVNGPKQPVVRVSWRRAMEFCQWLSRKTGKTFTLPTEAQWEYACRAGTNTPLWYGGLEADFSRTASLADGTLTKACLALRRKSLHRTTAALQTLVRPAFSDKGNDGEIVSAVVGKYRPNPFGLHDMHGNASEWTRSTYKPYPYRRGDGRDDPKTNGRKVARGGGFHDRPAAARSACRLSYPSWRRVFDVGFRVVCQADVSSQTKDKQ
ncbi:MAG: SUMF1/EgtB/PvdO family nonheme iron enzyme [Phycisphaerae bacterium]|nr:SUMF1/EgtB/PvdO family nonheme iron enzyme [Phycisphaerae bacterium]